MFLPVARRQLLAAGVVLLFAISAPAQRQMEKLGRGVVALHSATSQAYIGWRLLATDPTDVGFNLYRSANGAAGVKLNTLPLTNTTDFLDTTATFTLSNAWYVVPVTNGVESSPSAPAGLAANSPVRQYLSWPLRAITGPGAPFDVKFCWVGDLDGDGEYDYVVDRMSTTVATNEFLQAYKRDGTFLWQLDCGYNSTNQYNIEPGASAISIGHGDNVTVYDLDGDGKAEVCIRTARGVVLPDGTTISGPDDTTQYLSILDGMTGHELARTTITNMWPADGPMNAHFGIMYCDGVHPSLLIHDENRNAAGNFQRQTMTYDYRNGQLTRRWFFTPPAGANLSWGHQIRIMDVNHDGIDDLVEVGSARNGVNGQTLFDTELVHGDRFHITDIDPDRPGLEMFSIQQLNPTLLATALIDMGRGAIIKKWYSGGITDVGRGTTFDMDPAHRGLEFYSTQAGIFDCKGNQIYANSIWPPEALWWDADLSRELEDGAGNGALSPVINKFDPGTGTAGRMYSIYSEGVHQAYGGRAAFWGDILGDWREEVVLVANDYSELRVYTTKITATNRLYCLMQNPAYRDQATCKGYYQASYVDYFLGNDMPPPPTPPVSDAKLIWRGDGANVWDAASTANWRTNWFYVGNDNTNPAPFNAGDTVLFDLTGSNNTAITLVGSLTPGDVRIYSPKDFTFDSSGGSLDGATKLTKGGAGKVTFNGTNNFTGQTLISEGAFIINGALPNSTVTVRGGVWLDGRLGGNGVVGMPVSIYEGAGVSPGQGTNSPGTLTLANNVTLNGRTLNDFDLSDDASGATKTNDLLVINGNLTVTGTNTLVIHKLDATLSPGGVYPLVNYSGTFSGSLNNFTVAGLTGVPFALTNPPGQIALVMKNYRAPATITWTGGQGGNAWDLLTSSNWLKAAAKDVFAPNDTVRFDNTGGSNLTVTLTGDLVCSNLVVDSTNNYTLAGSGGIIGTTGLTKTNSGTLTISALNNSFTGKTILAGGTLVVSELDAVGFPSPLGNPPGGSTNLVLSGSPTLRVTSESYTDRGLTLNAGTNTIDVTNSTDQLTIAGIIAGSGALQKAGAGALAVSANNTFTGPTFISGGNLSLGGGTANQYGLGVGPGGNGNTTITISNATLTMFSDSGSYDTCYWNVIVPANTTATIYGDDRVNLYGSLTGGGTLNFNVYYVRTELDGNWSGFNGQLNLGTDSSGGDFRIGNTYGYANASVNLANYISAYHVTGSAVSFGALSGGPLSHLGGSAWTVGSKNTDATFDGIITGNSITKVGTGAWTLTGTNTYAGTTTVSVGTLLINGNNSFATGAVTVNSAGTLAGNGLVGGATTVNGKLSPGVNGIGTLAFAGNLTLAGSGTTVVEISKAANTNDLASVTGTLAYGGTLTVTNLSGQVAPGDSFKIFNAAAYSGVFTTFNLPPLVNASWVTTNLTNNGTISVIAGGSPVTAVLWHGDGTTNVWDANLTANWLATNGAQTVFTNTLPTTFDDTGWNNSPVLLATNFQPGTLTVNASQDYIFGGTGLLNGTNSLVKSGTGTLTLTTSNNYSGVTIVNGGILKIAPGAGLAHRWSFNNSLADAIGTNPAVLVDVGANNATLTATNVTLAGGTRTTADYVSLGANLLPSTGAPVTVELWATQNAAQNWARVFDFGASTTENLLMSWSQGTTLTLDRVEWKDGATSTADNTCQPYTLGTEFHIAMVIEPGAGSGGTTRVTWYRAAATNSALGAARGTFDSANTLAAFANPNCWLGRSEYTGDNTASASYDEVRVWNRALPAAELQLLHAAGPNAALNGNLPAGTALNLAGATAKFDNQSGQPQSLGSLAGVAGSEVKLTTGALIAGANNATTTFAGLLSGTNGFTKVGSGTLTLAGTNTATGACVVSNGVLLVNGSLASTNVTISGGTLGGGGTVAGFTTIRSGAGLSPGSGGSGTLTFSNHLSLQAGCTNYFEISHSPMTNDLAKISGTLTNGGTLVVTDIGAMQLANGDSFKLFSAAGYSGSFARLTLPVLPAGLAWNTNTLNTNGTLAVVIVTTPFIGNVGITSDGLTLSGAGGVGKADYYLLGSTNLAATNWLRLATNQFDISGGFNLTNPIDPNWPQGYYRIAIP
jgi:autotransporter-associated beta strand protein